MTIPKVPRPKAPARKPFDAATEIKATNRQLDKFRDDYQRDRLTLGQNFRRLATSVAELHRRRRHDENRHLDAILEPGALHTVGSAGGTFQKPPTGMSSLDRLRSDVQLPTAPGEAGSVVDPNNNNTILAGNTDPSQGDVGPQPFLASSWVRGVQNGDFHDRPHDPDSPIDNTTNPLPGWSADISPAFTVMWVADAASGSGGHLEITGTAVDVTDECRLTSEPIQFPSTSTQNAGLGAYLSLSDGSGDNTNGSIIGYFRWLESDSSTAIGGDSAFADYHTITAITTDVDQLLDGLVAPANAGYAQIDVLVGVSAPTFTGSVHVNEVRTVEVVPAVYLVDTDTPSNSVASLKKTSGVLQISAGTSGTLEISAGGLQDVLVTGRSLAIPTATAPSQTTDGGMVWDSDDDLLTVGTGVGRKTMLDTTAAAAAYQPLDADLTAFAALDSTGGYIVKTGANTYVRRSIAVGSGLSVSNADGVAGATSLDRAALTGDVTASAGSNATTLAAGNAGNLNSGTLLAARMPALTGDVTTSAGTVSTTLAHGNAGNLDSGTLLAARMPAHTGDVTSSAGSVALTLAAGSASNLNSGTLPAARMPALTGDVTTSSGAVATTIAAAAVTLAKMANRATSTFIGRKTAGAGAPEELSAADAKTILAITESDVASLTTDLAAKAVAGRVASSGLTTATATVIGRATAATGALEELATTGTGSVVLATSPALVTPALGTPSALVLTNATSLPAGALPAMTGDVTASAGSHATTIAARAVTAAKLFAATATSKILLRKTAGSGDWEEGSAADLKTIAGYYTSGDSPTFTGTNITGIPESGVTNLTTDLAGKSSNPHGIADHTDVTRTWWFEAEDAKLDSGTLVTLGTAPDGTPAIALADAATQGCFWAKGIPSDYSSGTLSARIQWSPGSTDASTHSVAFQFDAKLQGSGNTITAAGTTVVATGTAAARTASVIVFESAVDLTITPSNSNQMLRLNLRRIGADATNDTYVGVVNVLGVQISYTANQ